MNLVKLLSLLSKLGNTQAGKILTGIYQSEETIKHAHSGDVVALPQIHGVHMFGKDFDLTLTARIR